MNPAQLWKLLRRIDSLMVLEDKHEKAISTLRAEIDELKTRVIRLKAREDLVVSEAKAAAGAAAGAVANGFISDLVRRVTLLEIHAGQANPRLAPS